MRKALRSAAIHGLYRSRPLLGEAVENLAGTRINRQKRHFIRPELTITQFFTQLKARNVRYVTLRWFEDLPEVEAGHDLDLLIADEHIDRLVDLVTFWPVGQPLDIYSVTGRPGYSYSPSPECGEMAVFPPRIAARILAESVLHKDIFSVPNPLHHFLSLSYHATYLKGRKSGLRNRSDPAIDPAPGSHDYAKILGAMARKLGILLPEDPTCEDLDEVLSQHGWRPPMDVLERISPSSPWIERRFFQRDESVPDGLAVFLIRERAMSERLEPEILKSIRSRGFETLLVKKLTDSETAILAASSRGGNWGEGPYKVSGGPPRCFVVAVDVRPIPVGELQRFHPLLDNARIHYAKNAIREAINGSRPSHEQYNALHSTDNKHEAWRLINKLAQDRASEIAGMARKSTLTFAKVGLGVKELTRYGNRSRVDLIEWRGHPAVRKTFKPHCRRYLLQELEALKALGESPSVPRVLEIGQYHFVCEYVEDLWRGRPPVFLPLKIVRQLADFLILCAGLKYDPIDLFPRYNMLLDSGTVLKVIDFEFFIKRQDTFAPENSYCLAGVPKGFTGSVPMGSDTFCSPYVKGWWRYTGLSRHSFLHAPIWRQRMERAITCPYILLRWRLLPLAKKLVRKALKGVRRMGWFGATRSAAA